MVFLFGRDVRLALIGHGAMSDLSTIQEKAPTGSLFPIRIQSLIRNCPIGRAPANPALPNAKIHLPYHRAFRLAPKVRERAFVSALPSAFPFSFLSIGTATSLLATDTVDYVATNTSGNTATSTRTVIVEAATSSVQ